MSFSFRIESCSYTGLGECRSRIQSRLGLRYFIPERKSAKAQESVGHLHITANEPAGINGIADERETDFLAERIMKKKERKPHMYAVHLLSAMDAPVSASRIMQA